MLWKEVDCMRKELSKYFRFAELGKSFLVLLVFRCPFDFFLTSYYANLLEYSFDAMERQNERQLYQVFGLFLIATSFLFLYNGIVWSLYSAYVTRMQARVRKKLFIHISKLSYQSVSKVPCGEWVTRMNSDTQIASNLIGGALNLPHVGVACFNVLASTLVLVQINVNQLLLSICFLLPHVLLSQYLLARPMTALKEKTQEELSQLTCWIEPVITASEAVQLYDAKHFLHKKIQESSLALRSANMRIHHKNAIGSSLMPVFGITGYLALLVLGSIQINSDASSFGELTKVIQYRGGILSGCMMLISCSIQVRGNLAGVKRVNEVIENE